MALLVLVGRLLRALVEDWPLWLGILVGIFAVYGIKHLADRIDRPAVARRRQPQR